MDLTGVLHGSLLLFAWTIPATPCGVLSHGRGHTRQTISCRGW